ncbi:MAG: hypothetical protein HYT87_13615 [Nitrospirae bacterium]|nr:hypothetical protein [Nitrospirota bacterium]
MLFSALFSPQRIKSKIRSLRGGQKHAAVEGKGILVRIGNRAAEGQLASTAIAGRLAACLPLAGKGRKVDGLLMLRQSLPMSEAEGISAVATPGEILYWTEKQVILINTRKSPHTLEKSGRYVPLGRLRGSWRSAIARTPSGTRVTIEPWP